jgi:hypothetical protein
MRHSLFKYFSERKWADAFLDGQVLFRSLSYFRDYEDGNIRGDCKEGTATFRPPAGLVINNLSVAYYQEEEAGNPRWAFTRTYRHVEGTRLFVARRISASVRIKSRIVIRECRIADCAGRRGKYDADKPTPAASGAGKELPRHLSSA